MTAPEVAGKPGIISRLKPFLNFAGWVLALLALCFLLLVLWRERVALLDTLSTANLPWLVLAFGISAAASLMYILLWHFSARCLGSNAPYHDTLVVLSVVSITRYLPGGLWPLLGLVWLSPRAGLRRRAIPALALLAQGLHIALAGWLVANGFILRSSGTDTWRTILVFLLTSALLASFYPGYRRFILPLLKRFNTLMPETRAGSSTWSAMAGAGFSSLTVWLLNGLRLAAIVCAFNPDLVFSGSPYILLFLIWAGALAGVTSSLFFFVPLGLGAVELSLAAILSLEINTWPLVLAVLLLNRVLQVLNDLIFGLLAATIFRRAK